MLLGMLDSRTEILILVFVMNWCFWEFKSLAPKIYLRMDPKVRSSVFP